jgi:quinol monooxygenase YgiN
MIDRRCPVAPRRLGIAICALYDNHLVKPPFRGELETKFVADDVEIALLTATFDARAGDEERLLAALSRYVVLTRHEPECRNVDLVASVTQGGRFLVIEKWDSAEAVQAHLDSALMTDMATEVLPSLASKPAIDLHDTISAHDLM